MASQGLSPDVLAAESRKAQAKYGNITPKKGLLGKSLKGQERKYFDSGDYAMSKAGKAGPDTTVGSAHPTPEMIPHSHPPTVSASTSPAKESSLLKEVPAASASGSGSGPERGA